MTGKHLASPQEHTRRQILFGAGAVAATAAAIIATGEIPKITADTELPPPTAELDLAAEHAPSWDELIRPVGPSEPPKTRREARAVERTTERVSRSTKRPAAKPKRANATKAAAVIATSRKYFGIPYRWNGKTAKGGLDCSGYTRLVYAQHGVKLPHGSRAQAKVGVKVSRADARPGDLLFVRNAVGRVHHVAIYVGGDHMHDAPRTGKKVGRRRIWSKPSRTFYRRVL